jgi:hypothetical protein
MLTMREIKDTVVHLLWTGVEQWIASVPELGMPDLIVGVQESRRARELDPSGERYWALINERTPQVDDEYDAACEQHERLVDALVRRQLRRLEADGFQRLAMACGNRHLPADLRRWARRQYDRAVASRARDAWWQVAYAVLVLRDAAEWEAAHDDGGAAAQQLRIESSATLPLRNRAGALQGEVARLSARIEELQQLRGKARKAARAELSAAFERFESALDELLQIREDLRGEDFSTTQQAERLSSRYSSVVGRVRPRQYS